MRCGAVKTAKCIRLSCRRDKGEIDKMITAFGGSPPLPCQYPPIILQPLRTGGEIIADTSVSLTLDRIQVQNANFHVSVRWICYC